MKSIRFSSCYNFVVTSPHSPLRDRAALLDLENRSLAPYAVRSAVPAFGVATSRGRQHPEPEDFTRLPFQKDRDRILHCRAFRRLKLKTQVFIAAPTDSGYPGDHFRTRLSHSLEVSQVSRDVCRSLGLNEDLAESIALAHDLGHTPFGHAGEQALDELLKPHGLHFEHNEQSKRIVEELEQVYPGFRGLNLTFETRQGLMKHQSPWDQANREFHGASLEAQVVNLADEIAYNNHDVDDGLRSGLITEAMLGELPIWQKTAERVKKEYDVKKYGVLEDGPVKRARMVSGMIGLMIQDLLATTVRNLELHGIKTLDDVYRSTEKLVSFSEGQFGWNEQLKNFLAERIYFNPRVLEFSHRGQQILRDLFAAYYKDPGLLPDEEQVAIGGGESVVVAIRDYLAGMTDEFAEGEWKKI